MDAFPDSQLLLSAVMGSRAYGFDTPDSDYDRRGVVAVNPATLFGLLAIPESFDRHEPDDVFVHELRKFVGLAHKSNPVVLEVLWVDDYEVVTPTGQALIDSRAMFATTDAVRDGHAGSAMSQMTLLRRRVGDAQTLDARSLKYARHAFRFLEQGRRFLADGRMSVRVQDPSWYLGDLAALSLDDVEAEFDHQLSVLRSVPSVLQTENDFAAADALLVRLRLALLADS
jgi:hypothetical protein